MLYPTELPGHRIILSDFYIVGENVVFEVILIADTFAQFKIFSCHFFQLRRMGQI